MTDQEIEQKLEQATSKHPIFGTVFDMSAIAEMNSKGIRFSFTQDGVRYTRK